MTPTRSRMRGVPEAAGRGFVLGVAASAWIGESLPAVALSAVCGAVAALMVRRRISVRAVAGFCAGKLRAIGRAGDIAAS